MTTNSKKTALFLILAIFSLSLYSQSSSKSKKNVLDFLSKKKSNNTQKTYKASSNSSDQLAEDLLVLFNLPAIVAEVAEKSMELLIKESPDAKTYEDVFKEFGKRYLIWENLKKPIIKTYTNIFSKRELLQLKTFFSSSIGRKYIQKSTNLMQKATLDIQRTIFSYQEYLKRMIVEKELRKFKDQN